MKGKEQRDKDLAHAFTEEEIRRSREKVEEEERRILKMIEQEKRRKERVCDFPADDIVGGRISFEDEKTEEAEATKTK